MVFIEYDDEGNIVCTTKNINVIKRHNIYLIEEFLKTKKMEGCSDETIKNYRSNLSLILDRIYKNFEDIQARDIREFLFNYQNEKKIHNSTLDDIRRVLSSFYNFLDDENYIYKNPIKKIHKIKSNQNIKCPFSEEEIVLLQDACQTKKERALIDFLYSTGVRVGELIKINISDIDFNNRELVVFGKGGKERVVYFDTRTKIHLRLYLDDRKDTSDALFLSNTKNGETRISKHGVEHLVKRIGERAGVSDCHPHRFRRTLASNLIDKGMPIEQVRILLGHSKIDTTLIYAQVRQTNVKMSHSKYL